ncbi:helix-turn-helix domain-containing protein [Arthrobacter sp. PAMC25564]|uniref:PucR family transcriptional regulator n=1 Tax=Arthrobacter sp. PAMC25564 TaxID=2565366 RepID=UPI001445B8A1|nr:helix-turn-helix domain-containing protein [Arthrobacter sp. PAMC25564]
MDSLRPTASGAAGGPASDPEIIASAEAEIGAPATAWAAEAAADIVRLVAEDFSLAGTPGMMTGTEREGCEASLLTTLIGLHRGTPAADIVAPRGAQDNVRLSVRQGVPIGSVLRTVWACHTRVQDALLAVIEREVPADRMVAEVRGLNAALFSYVNSYVSDLMRGYEDELSLWHGRLPAERLRVLTAILDGEEPAEDAERVLGLRLGGHHLIAVARPATSGHIPDRDAARQRFGTDAVQALGATGFLTIEHQGTTLFWWAFNTRPGPSVMSALREVPHPGWIQLAAGRPGSGLAGLRESHFEAQQAARVARLAPRQQFWGYDDAGMLALLIADPQGAARFVQVQLAGLLGPDQKLTDIRDTLRHFLLAGSSRIAAAQALHLATNTVAYRVKRASDLLGRPVNENQVVTLVALQLAHTFPQLMDAA